VILPGAPSKLRLTRKTAALVRVLPTFGFSYTENAALDSTQLYYESMKRELKTRPIYECRCDERLKTKTEESTLLAYTGLLVELEHLEIETRLIDEMFASGMGEYVFLK
jgi:hypothetical protein